MSELVSVVVVEPPLPLLSTVATSLAMSALSSFETVEALPHHTHKPNQVSMASSSILPLTTPPLSPNEIDMPSSPPSPPLSASTTSTSTLSTTPTLSTTESHHSLSLAQSNSQLPLPLPSTSARRATPTSNDSPIAPTTAPSTTATIATTLTTTSPAPTPTGSVPASSSIPSSSPSPSSSSSPSPSPSSSSPSPSFPVTNTAPLAHPTLQNHTHTYLPPSPPHNEGDVENDDDRKKRGSSNSSESEKIEIAMSTVAVPGLELGQQAHTHAHKYSAIPIHEEKSKSGSGSNIDDDNNNTVLMLTKGTYGDHIPLIAIAKGLADRGYHVIFACEKDYHSIIHDYIKRNNTDTDGKDTHHHHLNVNNNNNNNSTLTVTTLASSTTTTPSNTATFTRATLLTHHHHDTNPLHPNNDVFLDVDLNENENVDTATTTTTTTTTSSSRNGEHDKEHVGSLEIVEIGGSTRLLNNKLFSITSPNLLDFPYRFPSLSTPRLIPAANSIIIKEAKAARLHLFTLINTLQQKRRLPRFIISNLMPVVTEYALSLSERFEIPVAFVATNGPMFWKRYGSTSSDVEIDFEIEGHRYPLDDKWLASMRQAIWWSVGRVVNKFRTKQLELPAWPRNSEGLTAHWDSSGIRLLLPYPSQVCRFNNLPNYVIQTSYLFAADSQPLADEVLKFVDTPHDERPLVIVTFSAQDSLVSHIVREILQLLFTQSNAKILIISSMGSIGEDVVKKNSAEASRVLVVKYTNYRKVFSYARFVIMGPGPGSIADAVYCGTPILAVGTMYHDHRYWSDLITQLGIAPKGISMFDDADSIHQSLRNEIPILLQPNNHYSQRVKQLQALLRPHGDGIDMNVQHMEAMIRDPERRSKYVFQTPRKVPRKYFVCTVLRYPEWYRFILMLLAFVAIIVIGITVGVKKS